MDSDKLRDQVRSDRNWMERILHEVPGFRGYLGKDERRATDKILRQHLAQRIEQLQGDLDAAMRELTDTGGMDCLAAVGDLERVKKALERLRARLQYASYGYSGIFDAVKVREADLDRLYEYDAGLVEQVKCLESAVEHLADPTLALDIAKQKSRDVLGECRELDRKLDERKELLQSPAEE